jgi:hypothetical protein
MMVVRGNSDEPGFAFAFQPFYGLSPIIVLDPIGIPHVKLKQVNPIRSQISQALGGITHLIIIFYISARDF